MMSIPSFRSHGCLWIILSLLVFVCANVAAFGAAPPQDNESTPNALPLGTVTVLGSATCLSGATRGAACTSVSVSCPGVPDLKATLSQAFPVGTPKGTIILVSGHGGTTFFNSSFANTYLGDGYRVVQLAWQPTGRTPAASASRVPPAAAPQLLSMCSITSRPGTEPLASAPRAPAVEAPPSATRSDTTDSQTISITW